MLKEQVRCRVRKKNSGCALQKLSQLVPSCQVNINELEHQQANHRSLLEL